MRSLLTTLTVLVYFSTLAQDTIPEYERYDRFGYVRYLTDIGMCEDALVELDTDPSLQGHDSTAFHEARAHYFCGDWERAMLSVDAFLSKNDTSSGGWELKALIQVARGDINASYDALRKAAEFNNRKFPEYVIYTGMRAMKAGHPASTIPLLEDIVRTDSMNQEAVGLLAFLQMEADHFEAAYRVLSDYLEDSSQVCMAQYMMGRLKSFYLGMYPPAIEHCMIALEHCNDSLAAETLLLMAETFYQMEAFESAAKAYNELLIADSTHREGLYSAGTFKVDVGLYEEGAEHLQKYIDLYGPDSDAYFGLALAATGIEQPEVAVQHYTEVIRIDSTDEDAWYNRGGMYVTLNESDFALRDFTECLKLNNENADAWYNRALVLYDRSEFRDCQLDMDAYLILVPDDPNGYFVRGYARYNNNDEHGACADWKRCQDLGAKDLWKQVKPLCK